jgi:2-dehydro-3-deoxyphosphooctonate aldolase (KDO 8-P synthase)
VSIEAVRIGGIPVGGGAPLALIAGPCVIESEALVLETAAALRDIAARLGMPLVFKSSYDKANRTSGKTYRGPGIKDGLRILAKVKKETGLRVLTDVHSPEEAKAAAKVVDVLQIPAMLCRQTDLVVAAAKTGRSVNIKKGQFMDPWSMKNILEKATSTGNKDVMLCERGATFGYQNLVVDMRSIPIMKSFGCKVVMDAGHAVQQPGGLGNASGGMRDMIPVIARCGVAAGADGLFIEVHENPDKGPSDGPNMLKLADLPALLREVVAIRKALTPSRGR